MSAGLVVVVLAGGEGRRMGGLKALRPWRDTTLIGQALTKARSYAAEVAVVVRARDQLDATINSPVILDDPWIPGPLGGLASAITYAMAQGAAAVLTLPCDAPALPADLCGRLLAGLDGHGAAMAQSNGRWHPTCTIWRSDLSRALADYAASGGTSLKGFAAEAGVQIVNWGHCDPDPFINLNTLSDFIEHCAKDAAVRRLK